MHLGKACGSAPKHAQHGLEPLTATQAEPTHPRQVDTDHSGFIDYKEFAAILR
jgi:hypothetical protein